MLENIPKRSINWIVGTIKFLATVPRSNGTTGQPMFLYGKPGAGKTTAFRQAAKELGWQYLDVPVLLYDPQELKGLQGAEPGEIFTKVYGPDWARNLDVNKPAIIAFEEVTKAPPAVENAMMGMLLDRRVAAFEFPNWYCGVTGNMLSDRAGDRELSSPMRDRVFQVQAETTGEQWLRDFAIPNNLHPLVTSAITHNPGWLCSWSGTDNPQAFATARSTADFSDILTHWEAKGGDVVEAVKRFAGGMLGKEMADNYVGHAEIYGNVADPVEALANPASAPLANGKAAGFYMAECIAHHVTADTMAAACEYARRYEPEIATKIVIACRERKPEVIATQAYMQFVQDYQLVM